MQRACNSNKLIKSTGFLIKLSSNFFKHMAFRYCPFPADFFDLTLLSHPLSCSFSVSSKFLKTYCTPCQDMPFYG